MKKCTIVCGYKPNINKSIKGKIIGVDKGCLYLIKNGYKIDIAIGDFDSVSKKDFELIKSYAKKIIKLDPIKDDTDFEHTLNYVKQKGFKDIEVYGALGGRKDHEILNIKMLYQSDLNITYIDNKNKIFKLDIGTYKIYKEDYKYLSILAFMPTIVSINKTKYELNDTVIDANDNYTTSNEIIGDYCYINIKQGKLLVILSND